MTFDFAALVWSALFLTLWGYGTFIESRPVRRLVRTVCLVLALLALAPVVRANDTFVYTPVPCSDIPWWLLITRPDCW